MGEPPRVTTVYFVRHAESDLRIMDDATRPLTASGLRNRELVTAYLAQEPLAAVYSSPYRRAVDTVTPLAVAHGLTVQTMDGFRERNVVGEGWVDDYDAFAQQQWADFDYALPGGESLRVTQDRNLAALHILLTRHPGETLAVGSHGIALSTIIHHYAPPFGYEGFHRIEGLMPWLVRFSFTGVECTGIVETDLLHGGTEMRRELSRRKGS